MTFEEVVLYTRFASAIIILFSFAMYSTIVIATWVQHVRGREKKLQEASESLLSIASFFDADKVQSRVADDPLLQGYQNKMRTVQEDLKVLYSWNAVEYMHKGEQKLKGVESGLTRLLVFTDVWNCYQERAMIQPVDVPQARGQGIMEEADLSEVQPVVENEMNST